MGDRLASSTALDDDGHRDVGTGHQLPGGEAQDRPATTGMRSISHPTAAALMSSSMSSLFFIHTGQQGHREGVGDDGQAAITQPRRHA